MNNDLVKSITKQKNILLSEYKQKLNNIKKKHKVDFDIEYFDNNEIKNVIFLNLTYKSLFRNGNLFYNVTIGSFDYIEYDLIETRQFKRLNHKRLFKNIDKLYNLKTIICSILYINKNYINALKELDKVINNAPKITEVLNKIKLDKKDENS